MKKIVIVDDDPSLQDAFRLIFPSDTYEVEIFADGYPLVNKQFDIPDLFILDKQLSGIDGLDICRLLRERPETNKIPVIVLSASPGIRRLALDAGANAVLEKPFSIKTLRDTVGELVNGER